MVNIYQTVQKNTITKKERLFPVDLRLKIISFYSACLYKYLFLKNEGLLLLNEKNNN